MNPPASSPNRRRSGSERWFLAVALVGAGASLGYSVYRLPPLRECTSLSRTPLDHSGIRDSADYYSLLLNAAAIVPSGARVAVLTSSGNAERNTVLYRFAVALLPGRRIEAGWTDARAAADYVVFAGPGGSLADARLLLTDERGSVWRTRTR